MCVCVSSLFIDNVDVLLSCLLSNCLSFLYSYSQLCRQVVDYYLVEMVKSLFQFSLCAVCLQFSLALNFPASGKCSMAFSFFFPPADVRVSSQCVPVWMLCRVSHLALGESCCGQISGLCSGQNQQLQLEKELRNKNEVIEASGNNRECACVRVCSENAAPT